MQVIDPRNIQARATALSSALDLVWQEGQKDGKEHLVAFDSHSGESYGMIQGEADHVAMPRDYVERIAGHSIITHYHPDESPLSLPDMLNGKGNGCPIYAITPSKSVSWIDPTKEVVSMSNVLALFGGPDYFIEKGEWALRKSFNLLAAAEKWSDEEIDALDKAVIGEEGERSLETWRRVGAIAHFASLLMSAQGDIAYRCSLAPEVEAYYDALAVKFNAPKCRQFKGWRDVVEVAA